jgi:hypothetical protein
MDVFFNIVMIAILLIYVNCCCIEHVQAKKFKLSNWESDAHATFYGGADAIGTQGV